MRRDMDADMDADVDGISGRVRGYRHHKHVAVSIVLFSFHCVDAIQALQLSQIR